MTACGSTHNINHCQLKTLAGAWTVRTRESPGSAAALPQCLQALPKTTWSALRKGDRCLLQANDKFWDMEDQQQPVAREGLPQGTPGFEVEGPVDTEGVIRRIDRHLLPLLFSLALLCSIDRGTHTAHLSGCALRNPLWLSHSNAQSGVLSYQVSIDT